MTVDPTTTPDERPAELGLLITLTVPSAILTLVVRWYAAGFLGRGASTDAAVLADPLLVLTVAGGVVAVLLLVGVARMLGRRGRTLSLAAFVASAIDALTWLGIGGYAYVDYVRDPPSGQVGAIGLALGLAGALRGVWSLLKLALCVWAIHVLRRADVRAWLSSR